MNTFVASVMRLLLSAIFLGATATVASAGPAVASGTYHTIVLTDTGALWAWGSNSWGQFGNGTTNPSNVPVEILSISGVTAVAAGGNSTYVLKSNGTVWAWGENTNGRLGDGTTTWRPSPVAVSGLTSVVAIAAGISHALALKSDGTLWAWGANNVGQVGDGTTTARTTPVQVTSLSTNVLAISASGESSRAVKVDGTAWGWGFNSNGQTGDGTTTHPRTSPVQTSTLTNVAGLAGGRSHSFGWTTSGAFSAWGLNSSGQVGDGSTTQRTSPASVSSVSSPVAAAGGIAHSVAATSTGGVWGWGYNGLGAVGDGTTTDRTSPVQVTGPASVVSVSAGGYFSVAVSSDGRVWAWGDNYYGQIGDGTYSTRTSPVQLSDAGFAWRVAAPVFSPAGNTKLLGERDRHDHMRHSGCDDSLHDERNGSDDQRSDRHLRRHRVDHTDHDAQSQSVVG